MVIILAESDYINVKRLRRYLTQSTGWPSDVGFCTIMLQNVAMLFVSGWDGVIFAYTVLIQIGFRFKLNYLCKLSGYIFGRQNQTQLCQYSITIS